MFASLALVGRPMPTKFRAMFVHPTITLLLVLVCRVLEVSHPMPPLAFRVIAFHTLMDPNVLLVLVPKRPRPRVLHVLPTNISMVHLVNVVLEVLPLPPLALHVLHWKRIPW